MARGPRRTGSVGNHQKKTSLAVERRDWENAICSVCLEFPHNAVLLLCSSHGSGCRPYMCDTGHRFSNCLNLFKKEYAKELFPGKNSTGPSDVTDSPNTLELICPLCRGQVMGWTVVEPAREYLNKKKRSCMQDDCCFQGNYKKLRKHVRGKHASAKPRTVDPILVQKWKMLENQSEREDVMSVIRSTMPGAVVRGDYVLDFSFDSGDSDYSDDYLSSEEDSFYRSMTGRMVRVGTRGSRYPGVQRLGIQPRARTGVQHGSRARTGVQPGVQRRSRARPGVQHRSRARTGLRARTGVQPGVQRGSRARTGVMHESVE